MSQVSTEFIPTRIAILTVSNRRGEEDDTSGHYLRDSAQEAGHHVVDKAIVKENRYAIRAQVSAWIASDDVQVVLITGGTGLTEGDQAPEALLPLFDREVEGFGEVFRMLSFEEIGTSTLQSRAVAGVANKTLIFAMPGSTKACRTTFKDPQPSFNSPIARLVQDYPIKSRSVIAHIRQANRGEVALENTHPFTRELWGRHWTYAHNGQLSGYKSLETGNFRPVGETDSEKAFCWLLHKLTQRYPRTPGNMTAVFKYIASLASELR